MLRSFTLTFLFIFFIASVLRAESDNNLVLLKSRKFQTTNDFQLHTGDAVQSSEIFQGYYYRMIQFNNVLSDEQRQQIEAQGVKLLDYIPYKTFLVAIPAGFNLTGLNAFNPRTIIRITSQDKMNRQLLNGDIPEYSLNKDHTMNLTVQYYRNLSSSEIGQELTSRGCVVLEKFDVNNQFSVRINTSMWAEVASWPFVMHIEPLAPSIHDDTEGRSLHRSNCINTDFDAGRKYDGSGVSVALADDGFVGPHIDFRGRMTNFATDMSSGSSHGDMTSGICVGAGNRFPAVRGMATGAYIYVYDIGTWPPDTLLDSYPHIVHADQNLADYGTVVTSTSYSAGCNDYNAFASMTDRIMHELKVVTPVWSGGNNQGADCGYGAGGQWGNITGGFKQGKNIIAVANLDAHEVIDASSSHGPASDGRIKPDISANGKNQISTYEYDTLQVGGGTSAACPGIAGISAQLYQAYREATGQPNPDAALIKGCLLNSAWDIGNPGPDYAFGYGRVNSLRAVTTIEDERYVGDSVNQGATNTHLITVPAGTQSMKVMVVWLDPEGSALSAIALVNNLDMEVADPSSVVFNPWVLDPTPNSTTLNLPAVRGVDTLNNIEQVTIDNPTAGVYTVSVTGTTVPFGPQKYFLVFEFWDDGITVTYPFGGEGLLPGETEVLRWDAFGTTGTFVIEYSTDNGGTWNNIGSVGGTIRQYDWAVPFTYTGEGQLRITRGTASDVTDENFSIIGDPQNLIVEWACPDSMKISWSPVTAATGYEISMLGAMYMDSIGTSATNEFIVTNVNVLDTLWFSARALTGGVKGRRTTAIKKLPGIINCSFAMDMGINSIIPASGNLYSCGQGLDSVEIIANISNYGFNNATGFDLSYTINGGIPVVETYSGTITFGQTVNYTFNTLADLSAGGSYTIVVSVSFTGDQNSTNDDVTSTVTTALGAVAPIVEDFQGAAFPPLYWSTVNSNTTEFWHRETGITGSSGTSTSVAAFDNCGYDANGAEDILVTQLFDISALPYPLITFDVCYREYSGYVDALRVDVSTDCGVTYVPSGYYKESPQLTTVPGTTGCFTPSSASHWRKDSVDLSAFTGNYLIAKFVNIGDYGNWLYIDNINIQENFILGTDESGPIPSVGIFPNPSTGIFRLDLNNIPGNNLHAEVMDAHGRIVADQHLKSASKIQSTFDLSTQPSGIYYLRISTDQKVYHLLMTKI